MSAEHPQGGGEPFHSISTGKTSMPALKIGIQLASLRVPLNRAIPLAARMGANGVEIDARHGLRTGELTQTALRELRKTLDDYRVQVCAVSYRTRRGYGTLAELDARVNGTKEAMRMAHALGASIVVNHVGNIPAKPEGEEWNLLQQVLTDLGNYGHHIGALLAAQTGGADPNDLKNLIAALPDGSLFVDFDPGQLTVNGFSPTEALPLLASHIIHVHATDGVRDLARGRGIEVQLGRGSVDFPELLATLAQSGYRGYFTLQSEDSTDPAGEIGQAIQYLRSL
jgi:sugar phosphate isomerase/epimerase